MAASDKSDRHSYGEIKDLLERILLKHGFSGERAEPCARLFTETSLDMAMSQFSYGKMELLSRQGEKFSYPAGFDRDFSLTNDPGEILASELALPMGYWKGTRHPGLQRCPVPYRFLRGPSAGRTLPGCPGEYDHTSETRSSLRRKDD